MIKILLVDDHELVRTGIRHILKEVGDMDVVGEAADGDSALKVASKLVPDVVLMDVKIPGMGGIEATRRMIRLLPNTRVIASRCSTTIPSRRVSTRPARWVT